MSAYGNHTSVSTFCLSHRAFGRDRINAMNVLIESRRLKVSNRNKHLIRTLEQHAYDDRGRPEKGGVAMDDLSHAGDAAGYACYRLAAIRQWKTGRTTARQVKLW